MKNKQGICVLLAACLMAPVMSMAATPYPFRIDSDNLAGAPSVTLNDTETGAIDETDRVFVKEGHFYRVGADGAKNTADDKRIRFWGTNISTMVTYPPTDADAHRLARRLQRMGFNIVRLVGLDKPESASSAGIVTDYPSQWNAANLARLDYLIATLKQYGIYTDLVLKGSYTFSTSGATSDGVRDPAARDSAHPERDAYPSKLPNQSVPLALFDDRMIELQKSYFSNLLNHVNPYTGYAYKDDPGIALIETINEATLFDVYTRESSVIPPLYAVELDTLWNQWLLSQPGIVSTPDLASRWGVSSEGANLLSNPDFANGTTSWELRDRAYDPADTTSYATWSVANGILTFNVIAVPPGPGAGGAISLHQRFQTPSGTSNVIEAGKTYVVRFRVDSPDHVHRIVVDLKNANDPYDSLVQYGNMEVQAGPVSREYAVCFNATKSTTAARLIVRLGLTAGSVNFDYVRLAEGAAALTADESLEQGTITRPNKVMYSCTSPQKMDDYVGFLRDTEKSYYQQMMNHLRDPLQIGTDKPVSGTQAHYSSLLGQRLLAETTDFLDLHYYWDHPWYDSAYPTIPNAAWWMNNTPMVDVPRQSFLDRLLGSRVLGKPLVYTEYSQPSTNQYAEEGIPIMASYAALQDVDGIFLFNYHRIDLFTCPAGSPTPVFDWCDFSPVNLRGFFNVLGETRLESLSHLGAHIFRRGDVSAADTTIPVLVDEAIARKAVTSSGVLTAGQVLTNPAIVSDGTDALDLRAVLQHRLAVVPVADASQQTADFPSNYSGTNISDTGQLLWQEPVGVTAATMQINTDHSKAVTGHLDELGTIDLGGIRVTDAEYNGNEPAYNRFATVSVTSTSASPLATAPELLVTNIGRGTNSDGLGNPLVVFDVPDNSGGARGEYLCHQATYPCPRAWSDVANAPFLINSPRTTVELTGAATAITVERLGANGNPLGTLPTTPITDGYAFTAGAPGDNTPWYRVSAVLPDAFVVEAESGTTGAGGGIVNETGVSSGRYVRLVANDTLALAIPDNVPRGRYYIEARARAFELSGPARVDVYANGVYQHTVRVADVLNGAWMGRMLVPVPITLPAGSGRTLWLTFVNDSASTGSAAREVAFDVVRLYRAGTQPHNSADLSLAMTDSPEPVLKDSIVTYTITLTNNGPAAASSVMVTGTLPSCNLGTIASGASASCTRTATAGSIGMFSQTVTASAMEYDPSLGNNTSTATTTVVAPDLVPTAMSATKSGKTIYVSDTVQNQGDGTAGLFNVVYYLSTNTTFEAGTDIPLASSSGGSGTCARSIASLAPGAPNSISNKVCYKPAGAVKGVQYYVLVVDDSGSQVTESNETNNVRATSGRIRW